MMMLWKKKRQLNIIDTKGFTLVELLVVIAIISVLGAVVAPNAFKTIERSQTATDEANLKTLNQVSAFYGHEKNTSGDIFAGFTTDQARIEELVNEEFLEQEVKPKRRGMFFSWSDEYQRWFYTDEQGMIFFVFNGLKIASGADINGVDGLTPKNAARGWEFGSDGFLRSTFSPTGWDSENILFAEAAIAGREYQISLEAAMNDGAGYGILFDTTMDGNTETGYILQYERTSSGGRIIIRPRVSGFEQLNIARLGGEDNYQNHYLWDQLSDTDRSVIMAGNNRTPILKSQNLTAAQLERLEQSNSIRLEVSDSDNLTRDRKINVFLNDEFVFSYDYNLKDPDNPMETSGLRVWNHDSKEGNQVTFSSLEVTE